MKLRLIGLLLLFPLLTIAQDSLYVTKLLKEGKRQPAHTCLPIFYATKLLGVPYGVATLEVNDTEQLVVNMRSLDCTTLVEVCVAMSLTTKQQSVDYHIFLKNMETIRYRNGKMNGYASRNHYFTQWISSNERQGIVREITSTQKPFTATQKLDLHYMTAHPQHYRMLRDDPHAKQLIRKYEQEESGRQINYIPRAQLNGSKSGPLGIIKDGDILAIVTKKDGLDVSHIGFAKWSDGKLHLLNASQIHKKVVLEPMTLYEYMGKHPSQLGIRVIRLL
ncbi:MAG: DUF1460 domain-containing protein [Bacteroidaceae bacterium]|nr:DUF1460 domain-containing protein [Bacteroidaceae bacterium]